MPQLVAFGERQVYDSCFSEPILQFKYMIVVSASLYYSSSTWLLYQRAYIPVQVYDCCISEPLFQFKCVQQWCTSTFIWASSREADYDLQALLILIRPLYSLYDHALHQCPATYIIKISLPFLLQACVIWNSMLNDRLCLSLETPSRSSCLYHILNCNILIMIISNNE